MRATRKELEMGWALIAVGGIFMVIAFMNPRSLWRSTAAWQYRNPDANEPSDDAYSMKRAGWAITGLVVIGFGLAANVAGAGNILGMRDPHAAAVEVTRQLQQRGEVDVRDGPDAGSRKQTAA